jgi:hypothetical protein
MVAGRIAAASAAVALVAFAAPLLVGADRARSPSQRLGVLAGTDASAKPARPAPQPALTDGDVPPGAEDAPAQDATAGRRRRPSLAAAPREVVLYSRGCDTWLAVEPWVDGRRFGIEGLERSCNVGWTPAGDLVSVRPDTRGSRVAVQGRGGDGSSLTLPGRVEGAVAVAGESLLLCTVRGGDDGGTLVRWRVGDDAATSLGSGCQPAIARDGTVAWAVSPRSRGPAHVVIATGEPGRRHAALTELRGASVHALAWTGDGRRLLAVVRVGGRTRVLAVERDGRTRELTSVARGSLAVHPSPAGGRVVVTAEIDGRASVRSLDSATAELEWSLDVDGAADVAWAPSGSRLLLADRRAWTFVEPATGRVALTLDRLGDAPAWCCPPEPTPSTRAEPAPEVG